MDSHDDLNITSKNDLKKLPSDELPCEVHNNCIQLIKSECDKIKETDVEIDNCPVGKVYKLPDGRFYVKYEVIEVSVWVVVNQRKAENLIVGGEHSFGFDL